MAKREFQALRPPLFAFALLFCGAAATVMGMTQAAEGAGIRTGNAPASVSAQSTLIFLPDDAPDYDSPDLCAKLGGTLRAASGDQRVCSSVDANDTFCIAGSADAFPCQGLYKHALVCNQYNRPALNPFFCGAKCAAGEFACGAGCARGNIPPVGRIPYVAGNYVGDVFEAGIAAALSRGRATVALPLGKARFGLTLAASALSVGAAGTVAAVGVASPVLAGSEHAGVLRAHFSCGGLASSFSAAEVGFTVTALAAQPVLTAHYEAAPGTWGTVTMTIAGINQLAWEKGQGNDLDLDIRKSGEIEVPGERPSVGGVRLLVAEATSPDFLGEARVTARAEFHHPFNPVFGPNHCKNPANHNAVRAAAGCAGDASCLPSDASLIAALNDQNDSALCQALRESASARVTMHREGPFTAVLQTLDANYPLAIAAKQNRVAAAEILTGNEAALSPAGQFGALNYAALGGAVTMAHWLLDAGADPNRRNPENNSTALFYASSAEMVNLLVGRGASVTVYASAILSGINITATPLDFLALHWLGNISNERVSLAADALRELGGECLAVKMISAAHPSIKRLCGEDAGATQSSQSPGSGDAVCAQPEVVQVGEFSFHMSSCGLECPSSNGGRVRVGEWTCLSAADASGVQSECGRRMFSESGLSCAER